MTPARLDHYRALGWVFDTYEWESYHSGTPYTDYRAQSPRLKRFQTGVIYWGRDYPCVSRTDTPFEEWDERQMLRDEKAAYIQFRVRQWRDSYQWQKPIERALAKDPEAKRITVTLTIP